VRCSACWDWIPMRRSGRTNARARKDWPAADAIRDQLTTIGLKVEDTPTGPRWSLEN